MAFIFQYTSSYNFSIVNFRPTLTVPFFLFIIIGVKHSSLITPLKSYTLQYFIRFRYSENIQGTDRIKNSAKILLQLYFIYFQNGENGQIPTYDYVIYTHQFQQN